MTNLTVQETAQRLGVDISTVARWIRDGMFPNAYKLNPRARNSPYRIPESDVLAIERERARETAAEQ